MNDARKKLLESVREGECEELLEMYMHAVARDRGRPVDTFSRHELVEVLQNAARHSAINRINWYAFDALRWPVC